MSLTVVDASVLTVFYAAGDDPRREAVLQQLATGDALYAPAHLDAEVVSALGGLAHRVPQLRNAVPQALRHLANLPVRRMPLAPLLQRMWALRDNVTAYDAAYVALAEHLDAPLLTCNSKLAAATGPSCSFNVIT